MYQMAAHGKTLQSCGGLLVCLEQDHKYKSVLKHLFTPHVRICTASIFLCAVFRSSLRMVELSTVAPASMNSTKVQNPRRNSRLSPLANHWPENSMQ